jgi:transposase
MRDVKYIKKLYEEEGVSLREIAVRTRHDFRTVRKYAYQEDWSPRVELPKAKPSGYPVMGKFLETVNSWLEQDKLEPRKQRHTAARIYDRLKKECGYTGSYESVKRYVAYKKTLETKACEGFLPLIHPFAHAQVDFGEFKYYDGLGRDYEGHALVVSFVYSNAAWIQVFPSENQECLLEGMKRIFAHIGGTPIRGRFDNMSTAVVQVLEGAERVISEGFTRFMLQYRFQADFCNPAKGNEKGNVENKVGYTRRNILTPVPTITDFEEFNANLLKECDADLNRVHYEQGKKIAELWEEERGHLLTLPRYEYEVFKYESATANKYGEITADKMKYGLAPTWGGKTFQVKVYFDKVEIFHDHSLIKTFRRNYNNCNVVTRDWPDYLETMSRKPRAIPQTEVFGDMPRLWQEYLRSSDSRQRKSAVMLLMEIVGDGNVSLCDEALELAHEGGRTDIDSVRQCYYLIGRAETYVKPLELSAVVPKANFCPDLTLYDGLTQTRGAANNEPSDRADHADAEIERYGEGLA